MASYHGLFEESRGHFPSDKVLFELRWWLNKLEKPNQYRQLHPRGPLQDLGIYVDALTEWGIGVVIGGKWAAFRLSPGWKIRGRDICWLETVAVRLAFLFLESMGYRDIYILI